MAESNRSRKRKRRGSGEGSIYRRKDGVWVASLTVGTDAQGRQRRRVWYGQTQAEAAEKLARNRARQLDGTLGEPTRLKVGKYLERWKADASDPRTRQTTAATYERLLRLHVEPYLAGVPMAKLGPAHVQGLLAELERQGVGARTRQATHRLLHRAFGDAVRFGLLRANPCTAVDAPRVPRSEPRHFNPEQLRQLLEAAEEDARGGALAVLLVTAGLRVGEALALRWRDVSLREGWVDVAHTLVEVKDAEGKIRLSLQEPKTPRSRRRVELPPLAVQALHRHRSHLTARPHPTAPVLADRKGGFLRRSNVLRRTWWPLLERAGLPKAGFHAARHGHATALLAAGANPRAIAERLGHSRASLVLDVYGHVAPGAGRELAERMEALLEAGPAPGKRSR